jgi:tRNA A37 threonylcarbamoyltransferase TsaD
MSSSGLKTINFQIMTNENKNQKLSDSTDTAIAYSTCYWLADYLAQMLNWKRIEKKKKRDGKFFK